MESTSPDTHRAPDLLALARAGSLDELLAALFDEKTLEEAAGPVPRRANQIARLILSEAVRLIRLGTQAELKEAAVKLVRAQGGESAQALEERFPDAFRFLSAAAVTLRAATAPSSSGGEISVLRGWNGNAVRLLKALRDAPAGEMSRADLRQLFDFDDSYLSHLLRAMEAAGLVVRIRDGRTVSVHVGPTAQADHVLGFLKSIDDPTPEEAVKKLFTEVLERSAKWHAALIEGIEELVGEIQMLRHELSGLQTEIVETIADRNGVVCKIKAEGTPQIGQDDGDGHVERWLAWRADCDRGEIKRVHRWIPLRGVRPSRAPQRQGVFDAGERSEREALTILHSEDVWMFYTAEGATITEERQEIGGDPAHPLFTWAHLPALGTAEKPSAARESASSTEPGRELQTD